MQQSVIHSKFGPRAPASGGWQGTPAPAQAWSPPPPPAPGKPWRRHRKASINTGEPNRAAHCTMQLADFRQKGAGLQDERVRAQSVGGIRDARITAKWQGDQAAGRRAHLSASRECAKVMKAKFLLAKVTLSFCRCTSRTRPNWWKYPFSSPLSLLACTCAVSTRHGQPHNQQHREHAV
jgi:hypothetical protein